jgi:FemAB-related protein (PEP-CTERM system-associated)
MEVLIHTNEAVTSEAGRLEGFVRARGPMPLSRHPLWPDVLAKGLGHEPFLLESIEHGVTVGLLPLAFVRSLLFGRFLVSLPYLNYGGPLATDERVSQALIDRALTLAEDLEVRHLELRCETPIPHPRLEGRITSKVHMRRTLPGTSKDLWGAFDAKVRNQIRKGQRNGLSMHWGGEELLDEFYAVFTHNMRDLGTPPYGRHHFAAIVRSFPDRAEFGVVRLGGAPIAAALLLHGWGVTEVPSASSLRAHNSTCANMLLYWHLLERAVGRGQRVFDFGRSTVDSSTYRFKKQWGAESSQATWQYHVRQGSLGEMRPENPRYQRLISLWRRLPVSVTRWIGPAIVRGIP